MQGGTYTTEIFGHFQYLCLSIWKSVDILYNTITLSFAEILTSYQYLKCPSEIISNGS